MTDLQKKKLLSQIKTPADVQKLSVEELDILAQELRDTIIGTVAAMADTSRPLSVSLS